MNEETVEFRNKLEKMKELKERGKLSTYAAQQKAFLDDPRVQEFNAKLRDAGFTNARKKIKMSTVDETEQNLKDYFNLCEEYSQLPSLKSMCMYLGISVTTFNYYMNNPESEYSDVLRAGVDYAHSVLENGAMNNKINPAVYMFTASNFYGMHDSRTLDINAVNVQENNAASTRESLAALKEEIRREREKEKIKDAEFEEKSEK